MAQETSYVDKPRVGPSYLPVQERVKTWEEFTTLPAEDVLREQAGRCIDCGVPYCHALGCPLGNLIPEWNLLVASGDWREAYLRLDATNNLPEITGRICPAPCEAACTLAVNTDAVTIEQTELAIIERAFASGWVVPRLPEHLSGRSVAVVGSGPAGLSAAQQLRRAGHEVTLFERSARLGGLLRYGIPDFKLEKRIVDRRLEQMAAEGISFKTGVAVGEDISAAAILEEFDAVLLAIGAGEPRDLPVPGRELGGIHFAMDFLVPANRFVAAEIEATGLVPAEGKSVLVIGGGDTGSDCVGTANRLGAKSVRQIEILPRPPEWTEAGNPSWPYWPNILRTSSSHKEGCERDWSLTARSFGAKNGRVAEVELVRVEWKPSADGGPARPEEVPGSAFSIEAELVLLAMGFVHVEHSKLVSDLGLDLDARGNVAVSGYATSAPAVFTAGDAHTGASLIVTAAHHGRAAADAIDEFLSA
ncbi:MAG: glutamate synthase subunit beta [Gaiellaceae bacterium]|jgi:glutamate synthase (NADPH/NADH) small chain